MFFRPTWPGPKPGRVAPWSWSRKSLASPATSNVSPSNTRQRALAIAPALFDRQQPGVNLAYDEAGVARGVGFMQKADFGQVMLDLQAAIDAVNHAGAVGMVGYCWGGLVTYMAGSRTSIAAGVAYYGGGIVRFLEPVPRCPMQFHFGEKDSHIPLSDVDKIRAAFPQGEYYTYAAGHGFNCIDRASYDATAAHLALGRTKEFFAKHVG
jgi:carboxymethylenebutenolidase